MDFVSNQHTFLAHG